MSTIVNLFHPTYPHTKQKEVLDALDSGQRFLMLRAGRKWRKTSLIISWLFEKAMETGLSCPYVAPNRIQAKNIVWDDHIQRILGHFHEKGLPYKKNEVELSIKIPNGGKVQLLGVKNKEALRGISNWGAFAGDEYDDWSEDIWPTIIRPNLMVHKAQAILAGTPKGFSNLYRIEESSRVDKKFKCFHFSSFDNPYLDQEELKAMVEEYKLMGMGYYRQEILAEYEKPVGVVYEDWDMATRYIPLEYDPKLPLHLSWDFGVNDPTSIIFIQIRGSEVRVIDYIEASDANVEYFVSAIAAKPYKTPVFESGDIAGRARDLTTGKSPIEALASMGHHITTSTIPDIPSQIRQAHTYMSRLYVSSSNPNCIKFRDCLVNYKYPEKKETSVNQSNEIPIHDQWSHAMRALEYWCWNYQVPTQYKIVRDNRNWRIGT